MADYDVVKAQKNTIEYYRLVKLFHSKDPYAVLTTEADQGMIDVVKSTTDVVEMNRKMMEEGYVFSLNIGMVLDGHNLEKETYELLEEGPMADHWKQRIERIKTAQAASDVDNIIADLEQVKTSILQKESRLKSILETIIEKIFLSDASPQGSGYDQGPNASLSGALDELNQLMPGTRFPDMIKIPRFRKRLFFSDEQLDRVVEIFEKVNDERLGGKY